MKDRIIESCGKYINLHGVKRFTLDDIAKDLSIAKRTIYKYFKSKDELVSEFVNTSIKDNIENTIEAVNKENTLIDKINAALLSHHKYEIPLDILEEIEKHYPNDWKNIEEQRSFKLNIVRDLIKEGIETKELRSDINIEVLSLILERTTRAILEYNFLIESNLNINNAVKEIENILLYGILEKSKVD
ncbi:TetR/AcrR family transcriptional regulator [Alkaliphilus peptidifermentans]|uniref:Transcriptional regulator, TetR family n=1 Tax=Alkaliphilus peptidifermentans DSM 18978 TaxID=1120976 RepID=A0A1G5J0L5_9FIRM|nr:TetR/AcrR family transcriptional regulator [Alkaliphilus peptidifermentans]SCY81817.1 transcriptional regulator, TetR family [Alkaliphilus peptidifermentans DSM 18978]